MVSENVDDNSDTVYNGNNAYDVLADEDIAEINEVESYEDYANKLSQYNTGATMDVKAEEES